jgi:hypothetical protein
MATIFQCRSGVSKTGACEAYLHFEKLHRFSDGLFESGARSGIFKCIIHLAQLCGFRLLSAARQSTVRD